MVLKLTVCRETDGEEPPFKYLFSQEYITIGQGAANHLTLPDTSGTVRDQHVVVRQLDESCRVIRCGEDGETAVNGDGTLGQQSQKIRDGDLLEIGPFQIEFQFVEDPNASGPCDRASEEAHPFEDSVDRLVSALESLAATYEVAASDGREAALAKAFRSARSPVPTHEAVRTAVRRFVGETEGERTGEEEHSDAQGPFLPSGEDWPVLRTVTNALATALNVPSQFRHEFIGHALSHPPGVRFLYKGDGALLRSTLMDPSLSRTEREKRFQYVEEAAEALVRHQIAVVKGYKASVINGGKELLARVNPDTHRDDVLEENDIFRYLPALAQSAVLERVREACRDLLQEDWGVAEQRIFRPAFRRAYLAQITAPHQGEEEHDQTVSD